MIRWLLDLIYPPRCVLCHKLIDSSRELVCDDCGKLVLSQDVCVLQGKKFTRCIAPLAYDGAVRESLHRFKFSGRKYYAKTYAYWLAAAISREFSDFDFMTWVPVSRKRKRKRGYDQSRELCVHTARLLGVEAVECLQKVRDNRAQSSISNHEMRSKNVKGVYCAVDPNLVFGKRILLIDDIATTGATLEECSCVLRNAGANEVLCATLAQVK